MSQKLTFTRAGTGDPVSVAISNMFPPISLMAAVEDYGIYKIRCEGPIGDIIRRNRFEFFLNDDLTEIRVKNPKKSIFILHRLQEVEVAIRDGVESLHMNDGLVARYEPVLRYVEQITHRPFVNARFGLPNAVSEKHSDFSTVCRSTSQIRDALQAGIPLGEIQPLPLIQMPRATPFGREFGRDRRLT